jgi:cytochrome c oxidase subunit II
VLASVDLSLDELTARGERVHTAHCAACHQVSGEGIPNVFPAIKGSPVATGPVGEHLKVVLDGRSGTFMQGFAGQLSDLDLAAVVTYQRNAWGNATNDLVQPAQISAIR